MRGPYYFYKLTLDQAEMLVGQRVVFHWAVPGSEKEDQMLFSPEINEVEVVNVKKNGNVRLIGSRHTIVLDGECGVSFDFDPPWEAPGSPESDASDPGGETLMEKAIRLRGELEAADKAAREDLLERLPELPPMYRWELAKKLTDPPKLTTTGNVLCIDRDGGIISPARVFDVKAMELYLQGLRIHRPDLFE